MALANPLCGFGLAALLAAGPISAQVVHDFRLLPDPRQSVSAERAYFAFESAAGMVIRDHLTVRNDSGERLRLSLYAADAVTASHGGIAVATRLGEVPERGGSWLEVSASEISLDPGEERAVPFTVRLPADLPPGEYAASLVAQRAEEKDRGASGPVGVRFIPRFAVTVLLTVPGPEPLRPALEIADLEAVNGARQQAVVADLGNPGDDGLARAAGALTVRRTDGRQMQEIPVRLGYFLAGDSLDFRVGLERVLAAGEYDVTLSLTHEGGTAELTRRLTFGELAAVPVIRAQTGSRPAAADGSYLPPWLLATIGGGVLVIAFLVALLAVQSRRLARLRAGSAPE